MYTLRRSIHSPLLTAHAAQRLRQSALLWLLRTRLPQTPTCVAPTARTEIPGELGRVRSHTRASRFNPRVKAVLPKLRTAPAFSAHHSTHWTLPTMSCFAFPSLLFHWMLDFALVPRFPLVSRQEIFIRMPFSPNLQLVLVGFLVVQSIRSHPFDGGFDLAACLKSQMVRHVS